MRTDVKKQLRESEDVHNNLKWNIEQNKILITFLETRLDEVTKRVKDREEEIIAKEARYAQEVLKLKAMAEEQGIKLENEMK
jgi:hypothetical protein